MTAALSFSKRGLGRKKVYDKDLKPSRLSRKAIYPREY